MNGQHNPPNCGFIPGPSMPQMVGSTMARAPPPYSNPGNPRLPDLTPRHTFIPQSNHSGWTSIDNITVPYIMRGQIKFVSVKMVENKLLSKFPKINISDLNNVGPIYSYYISDTEAKLLTEINNSYNRGLNIKPFSTKDLIVSLEDFERFYNRAKQHFSVKGLSGKGKSRAIPDLSKSNIPPSNPLNIQLPSLRPAPAALSSPPAALSSPPTAALSTTSVPTAALSIPSAPTAASSIPPMQSGAFSSPTAQAVSYMTNSPHPITIIPSYPQQSTDVITVDTTQHAQIAVPHGLTGGWIQINNTVVPYLLRNGAKYVPMSVIKYAAGLLTDIKINGYKVPVTEQEYEYLNEACKSAGVNFTFSIKTKIIKLDHVMKMSHSKVAMHELPNSDPFTYAQWREEHASNNALSNLKTKGPINVISPTGVHQMPPKNPFMHQDQFVNTPSSGAILPTKPPLIPIESMSPEAMQAIGLQPRHVQTPSPLVSASSLLNSDSASVSSTRPPSAQSRKSITPPLSPARQATIKSLQFEGKTVSCLIRNGEKEPLALLEALVRLYFAQCTLLEFQSVLENRLQVPVHELSREEEAAFINFYGLKVKSLRSKSIISFDKFKIFYVQLKYIFCNKACVVSPKEKQSPPVVAKATDAGNNNNNKDIVVHNGNIVNSVNPTVIGDNQSNNVKVSVQMNGENKSTTVNGTSPLTVSDKIIKEGNVIDDATTMKRKSTSGHSRKSKFPKRLEDTVAMLKQRNVGAESEN